MSLPQSDITQTFVGGIVTLIEITNNGSTLRYTPNDDDGDAIIFAGNSYFPLALEATGFQISTSGSFPNPTLRISNVHRTLMDAVINNNNLRDEKVTFFQTLSKYIDGNGNADKVNNLQEYQIIQKLSHTKTELEFSLGHPMSFDTASIPRRMILRTNGFPSVGRFKV